MTTEKPEEKKPPTSQWNFIKARLFLPFNPILLWIAAIYGIVKVFQVLGVVGDNVWPKLWMEFLHQQFPDGNFTREALHDFVAYKSPLQAALVFWILGFLVLVVTHHDKLKNYTIQKRTDLPWDKLWKTLIIVTLNQMIVGVFGKILLVLIENFTSYDLLNDLNPESVPSFGRLMSDLFICNIIVEILTFYAHWILHSKHLYKRIHKIHHEYTLPIPMSAQYNHPFEHVFMNLVPIFAGPVMVRSHLSTTIIWLMIQLIQSITDHANIHIPMMKSPRLHNFHHESPVGNYGITGMMDLIHGTDNYFRSIEKSKYHRVIWPWTRIGGEGASVDANKKNAK